MPPTRSPRQPKPHAEPRRSPRTDDVAGKAYDARLMRRLLTYLRPYKLQVAVSAVATILKAATDFAGPLLVKIAVDTYMSAEPQPARSSPGSPRHLSRGMPPMRGITEIAALYLGSPPRSPSCSNSCRPT